ncbi:hypothetical protein FRC03_012456 [Tulasnella sp. 419]|nr:hypothetical protein FRC03_012456 [Tulasnella sp. 419]
MSYIRNRRGGSRLVPGVLGLIWVNTFISTALQMHGLRYALISQKDVGLYFQHTFRRRYFAIGSLLYFVNTLLSDSLICWRLYVVWNRSKAVLIVPVLLLITLTVSGSVIVALTFICRKSGRPCDAVVDRWLRASVALTLTVNILVTSLICWKIWRIGKDIPAGMETSARRYEAVMYALIESGGIYSIGVLIYAIVDAVQLTNVLDIIRYIMPQIVGIVPTLIVIRLHFIPPQHQQPNTSEWSRTPQFQSKDTSEQIPLEVANWGEIGNRRDCSPDEVGSEPERSTQRTMIS